MRARFLVLVSLVIGLVNSGPPIRNGCAADTVPQWIWANQIREPRQSAVMRRSFEMPAVPQEVRLRLAADFNRCRLSVNDEDVLVLDSYGPSVDIEVTDKVRVGRNVIKLHSSGGAGPAAVALSLSAKLMDEREIFLVTSADWEARLLPSRGDTPGPWQPAVNLGQVAAQLWPADSDRGSITAFDDYTQWKQAIDAATGADPATFVTQPGFEIQLVRSAAQSEGSWVSMAFDPQGRVTIGREDRGLLRIQLSPDGKRVKGVETINDTLLECRGLLYAYESLYANANNSKGLYRLQDTTGDDQFDQITLLREFPGNLGHGRNDLALGPDGLIYSIHGDAVELPTTDFVDHSSPFRESRRGDKSREGHVVRTDRDGRRWELVAAGLRNPFGIDFNADGELFTYDADAEFDMGAPWYRPTRLVQIMTGADYGWRGRTGSWPPYLLDHADNALPVYDVGKGSPTAVKSGHRSNFPAPYRDAVFALDWAYGRIIACHLEPRGAGYAGRVETFLKGRPLNVTDLAFSPEGDLYLVTGGRKTQSALYRIHYSGSASAPPDPTLQQRARRAYSRKRRVLRRQIEALHERTDAGVLDIVWSHLASPDPAIRQAARVSLEDVPIAQWKDRALAETDVYLAVPLLVAMSRSGATSRSALLEALNRLPWGTLTAYDRLTCLESYRLCLQQPSEVDESVLTKTRQRLDRLYPDDSVSVHVAPVGAGSSMNREISRLLFQLGSDPIPTTIDLLSRSQLQQERMHYLHVMRNAQSNWTSDTRRIYFESLSELDRLVVGGEGMPGFLARIRDEAILTLSATERTELGDLLRPGTQTAPVLVVDRPVHREWALTDIGQILKGGDTSGQLGRGHKLFREALCIHCHRLGASGGSLGPDLTAVSSRFSRRDVLQSILSPSLVIAAQYRNADVVTKDGQAISGRVVIGGDFRSPTLRIATNPLKPFEFIELAKDDIEEHRESDRSPMPTGLLNTLNSAEILDLLAFLETGGE